MKRLAIFAHYDKQSIIDEYVIFYLESLKKSIDKIIFVSDCFLSATELKKINHLVFQTVCEKHGEYDFGSYKRGLALLIKQFPNELSEADELVFANDSCYCLRDLENIFLDTESKDCDAWSLGDDYENPHVNSFYKIKKYYLQSYFIVFRKSVFLESFFQNFLNGVKKLEYKHQIIFEYEEGLGRLLTANNKKLFAYFSANRTSHYICDHYVEKVGELVSLINNISHYNEDEAFSLIDGSFDISQMNYVHSNKFYFLLEIGFPLLKRAIICRNIKTFDSEKLTFFWKEIVEKLTPFNTGIILNHLDRISVKAKKPTDFSKFTNPTLYAKPTLRYQSIRRILSTKTLLQIKCTKNNRLLVKILKIPFLNLSLISEKTLKKQNLTPTNITKISSPSKINNSSRLVIFAHYDKWDLIEDYVIDYLKGLKSVANDIVFVSDCFLSQEELTKIDGLASEVVSQKHGEYDFGSYKRGIQLVQDKLKNYEQLIICNDSCYLVSPLKSIFEEMEKRNHVDFWGMTQNTEQFLPHLQSYFVVFNKNVFLNQGFLDFFLGIRKEYSKMAIIEKYEVGLTQTLIKYGFTKDSFVKTVFDKNPTISKKSIATFPKNFPLFKVPIINQFMWKENSKNLSNLTNIIASHLSKKDSTCL